MDKAKQYFEINGRDFEKMIRNGLNNLSLHVDEVDALNVFPVPDGDTGSNMYLTLRNAIENAKPNGDLDEFLLSLSTTMLLGARGNSGVILSQIFKGFAQRLKGKDEADAGDLSAALVSAYKTAYSSVKRPVEGTMLTVAREGIEKSRGQIKGDMPIDRLFSYYLAEMKKSLSYTPTLLPALKEAGVVDSGGMGYILIVEGMLKALYGEMITGDEEVRPLSAPLPALDDADFHADSEFSFGYCMEFLLQLLSARTNVAAFDPDAFSDVLGEFGDSIVVVRDDERVKVHVHTKTPARVIEYAQKFGEFITFKLENMHLQHSQYVSATKKKHYELAVLAVSNGAGMKKLYEEFEYCRVIDGGDMMNISCQEYINAFDSVDADCIVVMPNNKNSISAAQQAAKLTGHGNIHVLSTTNVAQGYLALSMDIPIDTADERVRAFFENAAQAVTLSIARAVRESVIGGKTCNEGDYLAFLNGKVLGCHPDAARLVEEALHAPEIDFSPEYMQIFVGAQTDAERLSNFQSALAAALPGVEFAYVDSGHAVYDMIISLS